MTHPPQSRQLVTVPLVFLCAIVPFLPALYAGFVNWDDTFLVTQNPAIQGMTLSLAADWLTSFYVNHYHPLLMFSYALDHAIAGFEPLLFHATNLILHGLNTVLVLFLLRHFMKDKTAIVLSVLFFAMHPLRVEPVVWISARKDLLSTFFILGTVLLFIRYRGSNNPALFALSFCAAVLASLSKAIAVVIPFLLLAVLLTGPRRRGRLHTAGLVPFFALAVLTGVIAVVAQYSTGTAPYDPDHSLLRAVTLPFWNIVFYAWKTVLPVGLSAVYPFPENGGPDLLAFSLVSLVAVSVLAIIIALRKPDRPMIFGLIWILVCLTPVLQWIPVGRSFAADRFTYLPAIGFSLVVGLLLSRALHARRGQYRTVVGRAGILLLAVLGTVSYVRSGVWEKSITLWGDVLDTYPKYAEGYVYLGSALASEEQELPLAIDAFSESIRLDDRNPHAYSNRALASYQSTDPDTSMIISDLTSAMTLDPSDIEQQVFLAEVYHEFGMVSRSYDACSALLDAYPSLHRARLLRIRCAFELGLQDEVEEDIQRLRRAGIDISIERGKD